MNIREITVSEARTASEIEKSCLETAWSESAIAEAAANKNALYLGAFENGMLVGIACMYTVLGEGQLINLAVSEEYRRRNIAESLIKELILRGGVSSVTLEVATDNHAAVALYKKTGFNISGVRTGFYRGRDAFVMEKII